MTNGGARAGKKDRRQKKKKKQTGKFDVVVIHIIQPDDGENVCCTLIVVCQKLIPETGNLKWSVKELGISYVPAVLAHHFLNHDDPLLPFFRAIK